MREIRTAPRAVGVISEDLSLPLDEGIKSFAYSLIQSCPRECRVLGLSVRSPGGSDSPNIISVNTNRLLLSYRLWRELCQLQPHLLCYVPSASGTIFSFLRSRVLRLYCPRARVVMVSLQPRYYGWLSRQLLRYVSPDTVFVQDESAMNRLLALGCRARLLPSGVDVKKFSPVSPERKTALRIRYGLDPSAFTVLHVGHLTRGRNIEILARVRREHDAQVVLVGSSLPHRDRNLLIRHLRRQGVIVFDKYIPNIEEMYQLSDCYLFPVFSEQACIGTPLSVLEAMACNLPVVTVRYGNLPNLFQEGQGLVFADTPGELLQGITVIKRLNGCNTREKVLPFSWQNIARKIFEHNGSREKKDR